jgi:hypothetical protein
MKISSNTQFLSAALFLSACLGGVLGYTAIGALAFGLGALTWMKMDRRAVRQWLAADSRAPGYRELAAHGAPPVLASLAYQAIAGHEANPAITMALAAHALFVLGGMAWLATRRMSRVAASNPHLFSHQ